MIKSTLKIARYCPLVIQGFSNFFGVVSSDYGKPCNCEKTARWKISSKSKWEFSFIKVTCSTGCGRKWNKNMQYGLDPPKIHPTFTHLFDRGQGSPFLDLLERWADSCNQSPPNTTNQIKISEKKTNMKNITKQKKTTFAEEAGSHVSTKVDLFLLMLSLKCFSRKLLIFPA